MALSDILKNLGIVGLGAANQGVQALGNAMQAQGNPLAFTQEQENRRQQNLFNFQNQQRNTLDAYQKAELSQRQSQHQDMLTQQSYQNDLQMTAQKAANLKWLTEKTATGEIEPGDPNDSNSSFLEGHWVRPSKPLMITPPSELQNILGTKAIPVNKLDAGLVGRLLTTNETAQARKRLMDPAIQQRYMDEVDNYFPIATGTGGVTIPREHPNQPNITQVAFRNNNPGNLKFAGQDGAVPGDGGFARFQTPEAGYAALHNQIAIDAARGMNLAQYITKYAPPGDNNQTGQYIKAAQQALGVDPSTPLKNVNVEKLAQMQIGLESGATINPESEAAHNAKFNANAKQRIRDAIDAGDTKSIESMLDKWASAAFDYDKQYGPAAQRGKAALAEATKNGENRADTISAYERLTPKNLDWLYDQITSGAETFDSGLSRVGGMGGKAERARALDYWASQGYKMPVPLDAATRGHLATLSAVADSLQKFKMAVDPYKDQTNGFKFTGQRLAYSLGMGDPSGVGGLISLGEMDRIRGAVQALSGVRTGQNTLEQGEIHTPNFWVDSGRLMNDKLDNMISYLADQKKQYYKYGAKSGIVAPEQAQGGQTGGPATTMSDAELIQALQGLKKKEKKP